jgi:hypothetical protein
MTATISPRASARSRAYAAYQRFTALPFAARHAWPARYLPALRAGHVTIKELP